MRYLTIPVGSGHLVIPVADADAPVDPLPYSDNFDSDTVGSLPTNWASWDSTGLNVIAVADRSASSPANNSAPNALGFAGGTRFGRAWPTTSFGANVKVSASVQSTSTQFPTEGCGVFARGSSLNGTAPVCYMAGCLRSGDAVLYRFNGSQTPTILAQLDATTFIATGTPIRVSLLCNESNIRVSLLVQGGANAGKYLKSDGTLTASGVAEVYAINLDDATITAGGLCGVIKHDAIVSAAYFDDFGIQSAAGDVIKPAVSLTSPADGATWSGTVTLSATASDASGVLQVEFLVDGISRTQLASPPYTTTLNSGTLSNGTHTVTAKATDTAGNFQTSTPVTVTAANNNTVTRPALSRPNPTIGSGNLAYSGTPQNSAFTDAAAKFTMSAPNPIYLASSRAANPDMHLLLYTNSSNVYLDVLVDLLNYLDAHGMDRKDSFFHAAAPYTTTGGYASTVPPKLWWQNFYGSGGSFTNKGSGFAGVHATVWPGTSGQSLFLGYPERFRQITTTGQTAPAVGWTAVLEYCSAIDGNGAPTTWTAITTLADTTTGLTTSGTITFDPPTDWIPCRVTGQPTQVVFGGDYRYYYVRFRTTVAGAAPTATDCTTRDFLNCGYGNGSSYSLSIPVFNATFDTESKGWLTESQHAAAIAADSSKAAYFEYESRLPTNYGAWRLQPFISGDFLAWAENYFARLMAGTDWNGIFMDNVRPRPDVDQIGTRAIESAATFADDYGALIQAVWNSLPNHSTMGQRWVMSNLATNNTDADMALVVSYAPAYMLEFYLRPLAHQWFLFEANMATIAACQAAASPPPIGWVDTTASNTLVGEADPVNKYNATCYYQMAATAETFIALWAGDRPSGDWSTKVTPIFDVDFGAIQDPAYSLFATGNDPSNAGFTYRVYQRNFARALVLFKPLSFKNPTAGVAGDGVTTHALTGTFYPVAADGTVGAGVTSVDLANGQGVILMRISS